MNNYTMSQNIANIEFITKCYEFNLFRFRKKQWLLPRVVGLERRLLKEDLKEGKKFLRGQWAELQKLKKELETRIAKRRLELMLKEGADG